MTIDNYLLNHGINVTKELDEFNKLSKKEQIKILSDIAKLPFSNYERIVIEYLEKVDYDIEKCIEFFQRKAVEEYLELHPFDYENIK